MSTRLVVLVSLLYGSALGAQMPAMPDTAAKRKAMEKLAFIVGDWGGEATAMIGRGQQVRVYQTEWVRPKAMGQVLAVEGVGRRLTAGGLTDTLFHAFAVIDWSADRGYFMRSNVADGRYGEFPIAVTDNGFVWGFELPGGMGRVRYTMTLADGLWHENAAEEEPDGPADPLTFA
jgi:hypothetical protein